MIVHVADAMRGDDALSATIEFIDMFDKFFDCLNVKNMSSSIKEKNDFKAPYRKPGDFHV